MKISQNFWLKKRDNFILLLFLFILLLLTLFFYLLFIDRQTQHYDSYRQELQKMNLLNHKIESVFYKKYRYVDHDEVDHLLKGFQLSIRKLKDGILREEFGESVYRYILELDTKYKKKVYLIQQFEALNARLTNSVHTLFDLKKTIKNQFLYEESMQESVHRTFFTLLQIMMDIPYDQERLDTMIRSLKKYESKNRVFYYFNLHLQHSLDNIKAMKLLLQNNHKNSLFDTIQDIDDSLSDAYNKTRELQKKIAIGFFLLGFLILVVLIFQYRKERHKKKELLAFKYAIENSDNAIVITDKDRHIEFVNKAFEIHTGYSKEEAYGKNPNILKSDLVAKEVYKELNETLDRGQKWRGELINIRKNGSLLYEQASIVPIFMDGELVQYLAIKLDVTEYIQQQKILQQSATVYDTIGDGILISGHDQKIVSANRAYCEMFGYSENELTREGQMILMDLKQDPVFFKTMWYRLMREGRWTGRVHSTTKEGKRIPVWLTITLVKDDKGEIQNFIAIYTNLEEIIEMEEKANFLAYHDSLTKLPNRIQFEEKIVDIFEVAKLGNEIVAVFFIDLDRFKVINDTLGHHIGDMMLVKLSERIKKHRRENTLFARIGGDEFVIVVTLQRGRTEAMEIAQKLLSIIREPFNIHDYHLDTTASIGIAIYPDDGEDKNEILKHADSAMYHAKEKGKDNYQFYTVQLSRDVEKRLKLEQALVRALDKGEMTLVYQPQYDLERRKIIGVEALLRWYSDALGEVSPGMFIPIAEETGIIVQIGYFVFEEACREYMHWRTLGFDIACVSINMSSVQFREEDIFERLRDIIQRTGIPAQSIEIEITERYIMEYSSTNITILEDLRALGCKISIDDFGTGYSSMSYLKTLSLDTIKIDQSFIRDLPHNVHDAEVSKAIITLSRSLGYQVVAEGVETKEQEIFLKVHGCDMAQGYYFSKPLCSEDLIAFMKRKRKHVEG